ncbi:anti-sigma factor [Niveibacterium sp. SC-1]|uniref:anti-sigma factor n=1 Tax=Niveibacterium sp. SC-1 TaxID=3135646 RepID=UPI00311EA9BD
MNLLRPELLDRLASEYVLGTLRGLARKRFERAMAEHGVVRVHVHEWEERLAQLAAAVPEIEPPGRVWRAVEARVAAERLRRNGVPRFLRPAWWRGLALAMSAVAALLVAYIGVAPRPLSDPGRNYIVVLAGSNLKPVMLAEADPKTGTLFVRVLASPQIAPDRSLELWGLPRDGKPRSYGLVPASGVVTLKPGRPLEALLADIAALAVSLEPQGGSPTGQPTGPVLYTGELVRPVGQPL